MAITPSPKPTRTAVAVPSAIPAPTDTPRASRTPAPTDTARPRSPTPTPTALPSQTPAPTASATRTPQPRPTRIAVDPRYGLTSSWGCQPNFSGLPEIQWYYTWTYTDTPHYLGLSPNAKLVISVPDVTCASPEKDGKGRCINTRITTPADFSTGVVLTDVIRANPGAYWVLGNEPNGHPNRAILIPAPDYADWYHTMAGIIRRNDPRATLLIGGLAALEVLGNVPQDEYADLFWRTYQERYGERPPVDIWNIHVYPDVGRSPEQILAEFNTWRRAAGEDRRPLWITEFGDIRPKSTEVEVMGYMRSAISAFEAAGVERWFWYAGHDGAAQRPYNLWTCSGALTLPGELYRDLASGATRP